MTNLDELTRYIYATVAEIASLPLADLQDGDRLRDDLGLDSVQRMELLSRVSERFDIDPEMEQVMAIETVGQIMEVLGQLLVDQTGDQEGL